MKNSRTLFQEVVESIELNESPDEVHSIAYFLLTGVFDITKTDILAGKMVGFPEATALTLQKCIKRINTGEPVQYVLGEEYFYGRKFQVNPSVLIPRPETEGIIRAVLNYKASKKEKNKLFRILDIGTGSGCIPVTLFLEIPQARLFATDVSTAALSVAVHNADVHKTDITFIEHNILTEKLPVRDLDVVVSNPPYVTEEEKVLMKPNVLDHEPHQALFVPDNDPLIFYNAIAKQAMLALVAGGLLAVEINEKFSSEVSELFLSEGFKEVEKLTDIAGKPRVITGVK